MEVNQNAADDPRWDDFLKSTPDGTHVQSSLWGAVKSWQDWRTTRIVMKEGNRLVAGAQMLWRNVRLAGRVGYVPRGPVFAEDTDSLTESMFRALRQAAAEQGVRALFVQPAGHGPAIDRVLHEEGFRAFPVELSPTATVAVDLRDDLDTILARMKKRRRWAVRRSQTRGITVRRGREDDLPSFHHLLGATGERREFAPFPLEYFVHMWRVLRPHGHIELFLSEYHGEPVSAQLVVPWGNTVVAKQIGWSREHAKRQPNVALDWATLTWAKSQGHEHYDLEGIPLPAARAVLRGDPLPKRFLHTDTAYKLRFGGEVVIFPETSCYFSNPLLRGAYNYLGYKLAKSALLEPVAQRFRTS